MTVIHRNNAASAYNGKKQDNLAHGPTARLLSGCAAL
jgi:hypothetical protein